MSSIPRALTGRINHLASRTDTHIQHLLRLFQTAAGTDKILMTIYYTLKLLYPQITRLRSLRTRHALHSFIKRAQSALLPGETLIATLDLTDNGRLATLEASAKALAGLISDFRIFVRCWGLLGIYAWGRGHYLNPPSDPVLNAIVWGQVGVNIGFQWFENAAYLASKGVLRGKWCDAATQTRWWVVSCRFWAAHVGLEAVRLLRVWQTSSGSGGKGVEGKEMDVEARKRRVDEASAWRRAWYINAAYAPLTLHYSTVEGFLSDEWLGACGVIAGTIGIKQMWKMTA